MAATSAEAKIICPKEYLELGLSDVPENCELFSGEKTWLLEDVEMTQMILASLAVAIPLDISDPQPCGLTSLLEAMAHAKPVLMTKNPYIDIDIEAQGCGKWIEPNSPDSWKEGIEYTLEDNERALAMGRRGRELVDSIYNIKNFGQFIAAEIVDVTG
jgi:glycosyltransferase involved in cell wall biosynthesis